MVKQRMTSPPVRQTSPQTALVTLTSEGYVPGTLVLLESFIEHNTWFQGDIIVLHSTLSPTAKAALRCWPTVQLVSVSTDLQQRVARLVAAYPHLVPTQARFYALDLFRLTSYDRLFFCDSDLLFRGSVGSLLTQPHALQAVGDGASYLRQGRSPETFVPQDRVAHSDADLLFPCFNSGFLVVDGSLLTPDTLQGLSHELTPARWAAVQTKHTDQVVLNRYFAGQAHLLSGRYNYLLKYRAEMRAHDGVTLDNVVVIHFVGRPKPWHRPRLAQALIDGVLPLKAVQYWYRMYERVKEKLSLYELSPPS